jgi:hypothetical protein
MTNRKMVALWISPELKEQLRKLALSDRRSLSNLLEGFIINGLEKREIA